MPDGDIYHEGLSRPYQQLFRQVEQGHHTPQTLAYHLLDPFTKSLKKYDDAVIKFLVREADALEEMLDRPLLRQSQDWDAYKLEAENRVRLLHTPVRGRNLAIDSLVKYINKIARSNEVFDPRPDILRAYLGNVYCADWEALAKMPPEGCDPGQHQSTIVPQIEQMRPYFEEFANVLAEQIARTATVHRLRKPPAPDSKVAVEPTENLLAPMH